MNLMTERQLALPDQNFVPFPAVVSASRRTELVGLKPGWLVNALQRFPSRYKRGIHSVVLWTKDPRNILDNTPLRQELSKHNLIVNCTITGLGGTRIEPTVPKPEVLLQRLPDLVTFLGDPRRLRWRFDPIVTLKQENDDQWSNITYFEELAKAMAKLGVDNCYFSFLQIYQNKFNKRGLKEAGINLVIPDHRHQLETLRKMRMIAEPLGISLYSCTQPNLEKIEGITPAACIDAGLLTELHPQKLPVNPNQDKTMARLRPGCYCTQSIDIGAYLACGHGCVYCYAEAAVPKPDKLIQKSMPGQNRPIVEF